MQSNTKITNKLSQFIRKYYTNELLKGSLLFVSIGLLYFMFTLLIEYFLWLKPTYRTILFWVFVVVEIGLLVKFICIPLLYLFGIKKGINFQQSAKIIGNHFPEVQDKLLNLLQLQEENDSSELLLASINQKAATLSPIPFKTAINFKQNGKYLKYVAIPVLVFLLFQFTGNQEVFKNSYQRVVNHNIAYTPPAPFNFIVKNTSLETLENKNITIEVTTNGKVLPEDIQIHFNNETYYLNKKGFNSYQYQFVQLQENVTFNLSANDVVSNNFKIEVVKVPSITNFKMWLDYPNYIHKKDEWIENTGNTTLPEGTLVKWKLQTKTTTAIHFIEKDVTTQFKKDDNEFSYSKRITNTTPYQIATNNDQVSKHEQLHYNLQVIKDEFPEIRVQSKPDSLDNQIVYFLGKVSDDYGLHKLQLIYNQVNSIKKEKITIPIQSGNFQQFTYAFPNQLLLEKGKAYEYYFQISDNDVLHQYKKSKSQIFSYNKLTDAQLTEKQLKEQQENINNLDKSLQKVSKEKLEINKLKELQKEKKELSWMDKLKVKNIFNKQQKQNELMQKFNKDIQRNLENFKKEDQEDLFKEDLQKRLKEQEKEIEKNEKLLEELNKIKDKISDEELFDKIEKLSKEQQNKEKSLEQVLELTKRYYVQKKFEKLVENLEELAKKQKELSDKKDADNTKENQDALNKEFEKIQKDIENIKKENKELKKPMGLDEKKAAQEDIKKDQQEASEQLEKKDKKAAKKKQKEAAKKMEEMSMSMRQQSSSSSEEELEEDIKMLRQILDNLIQFSFDQESLLEQVKNLEVNFSLPQKLKKQHLLKEHFKHIDDSLFALSLRQPKISEMINKEVTEVHFNINKTLGYLADVKLNLASTKQQYALTSANNLANFLSSVLNALQNQSQQKGSGSCDKPGGKGESFSLPDIIQKQEDLLGKMKEGKEKGESGEPKDGEGNKPGESGKPENSGSDGKKGKDGKPGKQGDKGKKGEGDEPGTNPDENSAKELYEIYKQQQQLKEQLQNYLKEKGNIDANANQLLKQMEGIENQLLENGFHDDVMKHMQNIKHEMLKLMKASYKKGEENKREATTNTNSFSNKTNAQTPKIEQYFNEVEILNRQALPLQPIYKKKVQQYFK